MNTANHTCPKCGAALQDEARFCPHCMTSFVEKTALSAARPPKKNRLWLFLLLGILVIGAVVCAAILLNRHNDTAPAAGSSTTTTTTAEKANVIGSPTAKTTASAPAVTATSNRSSATATKRTGKTTATTTATTATTAPAIPAANTTKKTAKPTTTAKKTAAKSSAVATAAATDPNVVCSYKNFYAAAPLVTEKMGIGGLWSPRSLMPIAYSKEDKIRWYVAGTTFPCSFSLLFYNEGEEVYAAVCDVKPANFNDAEALLKCIVQSACDHYIPDIDAVFNNETLHPKTKLSQPFDSSFAALFKRTDRYNTEIQSGTVISTRRLGMTASSSGNKVAYFITERNTNDTVVYDLYLGIGRGFS